MQTELYQLVNNFQPRFVEKLENRCIITIIEFCIDFSTYDVIDILFSKRSSPIILSYELIKNLCNLLKVPHLFESFLTIYAVKLSFHLDQLADKNNDMYGNCTNCLNSILLENAKNNYYIGICDKNHKIIRTDGVNLLPSDISLIINNNNCYECHIVNREYRKYDIIKLFNKCQASIGKNKNEIIITDKNQRDYFHSLRRDILHPIYLPSGLSFDIINETGYYRYTYCYYGCKKITYIIIQLNMYIHFIKMVS